MRTFVNTTLAILLIGLLGGCDSFLEETEPSQSVSQNTALNDADGIRGVRADMYDSFHQSNGAYTIGTDWFLGPATLADLLAWRSGRGRHQENNRSEVGAGVGTGNWNLWYETINNANLLINEINEDALSQDVANRFKAEAYFVRALVMHHMVRTFGYDPSGQGGLVQPNSGPGADFDLGIVVRTEGTTTPSQATDKARATVQEVYSQITSDLDQANSLFSGLPSEVKADTRYRATEAAVEAIRARVELYRRNYPAANTAAQNAIDIASSRFGSGLATSESELTAIFDEAAGGNPEAIFEIETSQFAVRDGINDAPSALTTKAFNSQIPVQSTLLDLYESGDARQSAWYEPCFDEADQETCQPTAAERNDEGLMITKFDSERNPNFFADDYPMTRIAEMYLIQAEARLNTDGVEAAITRLNDLRETRGASTLQPANFTQESAMQAILDERKRELVAEGHRFFDLKRLGRDIPKGHLANVDDVPFNDFRILDDLPDDALGVNEELQQNPGY